MTASAFGHPSSSGSSRFSSTTSSSAHARRSPAAASSVFSLLKAARSQLREPTGFLLGQQVWACADKDSDVGHPPILRRSSCAKARREKGQDWACGAWPFFFSRGCVPVPAPHPGRDTRCPDRSSRPLRYRHRRHGRPKEPSSARLHGRFRVSGEAGPENPQRLLHGPALRIAQRDRRRQREGRRRRPRQ
jgi:hypothetical protein